MINITIEIDGVHQLMKTDAHSADKIVQGIQALFPAPLFQSESVKSPLYRFSCDEDDIVLYKIVEVLRSLFQMQTEWADDIPGFTVLVQKGGLLRKSQKKNGIGNEVLMLPEENGIWCAPATADAISHFVHFKKVEGYYKIIDFEREVVSPQETPELFGTGGLYDQLIDLILEVDSGYRCITLLQGPQFSGKRLLIRSALHAVEAGMGGVNWYELDYFTGLGSVFAFLVYNFDKKVLAEFDDLLYSNELELWKQLRTLQEIEPAVWSDTDLKLYFQLYLRAYGRRMKRELLPPVVIVYGFDQYPEEVQHFLAAQFELLLQTGEGIPVITLREEQNLIPMEDSTETVVLEIEEWHKQLHTQFGERLASPYEAYEFSGDPPQRGDLFQKSPEELYIVLHICFALKGLLNKELLLELLQEVGIRRNEAEQSLYQLSALGFIGNTDHYPPVRPSIPEAVKKSRMLDRTRINYYIEQFLMSHLGELNFYDVVHIAEELDFSADSLNKITRCLEEALLSDIEVPLQPLIATLPKWFSEHDKAAALCTELLACLQDGALEAAEEVYRDLFGRGEEDVPSDTGAPGVLFLYTEGSYLWRKRGDYKLVLDKSKKALLQVQEQKFPELEARATLLLGKVMLTNGRMSEAAEYFRQARQKTFDTALTSAACESTALTALTHFINGDYSLAASHAQAAQQKAVATGRRLWERYTMMLQARIQFELGRYNEAHVLFQKLLTHDQLYFHGEKKNLLTSWVLRSSMYQGFIHYSEEILENLPESSETLFFQAEGHLLNRDIEEAYRYIVAAIQHRKEHEQNDILPIARLPGDGFEPYESFALKIPGVYDVPLQIMYAVEGFLLNELGREEESEAAFERLFAQERLTRQDPYRHLYYYFRTITLPVHNEKEELNMTTLLSKAFQSLQKIAGRISDPSDRRSYVSMNYWNSRLYSLSRRYKLV